MDEAEFHQQVKSIQEKYDAIIDGLVKSNQTDQLPAVMEQFQAEMSAVMSEFEAPLLQEMADLEEQIALEDKRMAEEEAKEAADPFFADTGEETEEMTAAEDDTETD